VDQFYSSLRSGSRPAATSRLEGFWFRSALGLPITLLLLIAFFSLLGQLVEGPGRELAHRFDYPIAVWVHSLRSSLMDRLMWALTMVLEMEPVAITSGLIFGYLLWKRRFASALAVCLPLLGDGIMWGTVAHLVQRSRPEYWVAQDPADLGYPGGHVMNAVVIAGLCCWSLWPRLRAPWQRAVLLLLWALFIAGVATSRIYRHAHFATDNLAGFLMGLVWITVALRFLTPLFQRPAANAAPAAPQHTAAGTPAAR
jgi:membrane-associated phospholipid phosphatase